MRKRINFIILFSIFLLSGIIQAQPPEGVFQERMGPERIEKFKMMRMIEVLDLPEETAVRFMAKYNEHQKRLRDYQKQQSELQDKLENALKQYYGKTYEKQQLEKSKEYQELLRYLDQLEKVTLKFSEEDIRMLNEIKELFTAEQMARYYIFQRDFEKELREAMKRLRKDMPPRTRMRDKE